MTRKITRGDAFTLTLRLKIRNQGYYDLSGSTFVTKFAGDKLPVTFGNSAHTPDPDQSANKGVLRIEIDSKNFAVGVNKKFIVRVNNSDKLQFRGCLTVESDNPNDD